MSANPATISTDSDEVDYIRGSTRLFGIVGHPIEQVRSPEMFTAEFRRRGHDAILVPLHVLPADFDDCVPRLLKLANLGGLVFTIPYKAKASRFAASFGEQAHVVGAINALASEGDGKWRGEIFDGLGCVEGFRRRGISFAGKRVALIGAGGAGAAVGVAIASEHPRAMRLFDTDAARTEALAARIAQVDPAVAVAIGPPDVRDIEILLNVSPVGMLGDSRLPLAADRLPSTLVVFDAVVKPDRTPLLALAEACGCTTIYGREMMRGQIARMTDFFFPNAR
jgi:shikimate dehydrogenase